MPIDHATVRRVARLARLSVGEGDVAHLADELNQVLGLADQLAAAAVAGVEPMAHPHEQALAWREDTVTEKDRADAFLALAPDARGGLYVVPKVIE
jgi:aspartyl-tRNA(Asn)/glutamyl-tRNA(Gln) amidotransferase subunit C